MIQLANLKYRPQVRSMWKTCFNDAEEYMNLYFSRVYKDENTLLYIVDELAVASLQILPYSISFYGKDIPFSYISGACTLPEHRKKGYMEKLLIESFRKMQRREIPLSILIPGEDWLYAFYEKYGYTQCFNSGEEIIPLKQLICSNEGNIESSYAAFQRLFADKNLCVQKSKANFETIVIEGKLDDFPPKTNLAGMARVIDPKFLLSTYAKAKPSQEFIIQIDDPLLETSATYTVKNGECKKENVSPDFRADINFLTRLLFGFETSKLDSIYGDLFAEQQPIMNLMLE